MQKIGKCILNLIKIAKKFIYHFDGFQYLELYKRDSTK